tara:strand:+ start:1028 stop:1564 length:537 start_codon:yes stop_codon:yes gene_type:complete
MENLIKIDEYIFRLINSLGWESMDEIMILISSKWLWIPLYVYLIYRLFKKYPKHIYKIIISIITLILFADSGSVYLFKNVFERLRPCHALEGIRIIEECGGLYGFISSHAANAFAVAFFVSLLIRKKIITISIITWAILIAFSRIYLGVHYPFDVLGGMLWGLFVSLLIYKVYRLKIK